MRNYKRLLALLVACVLVAAARQEAAGAIIGSYEFGGGSPASSDTELNSIAANMTSDVGGASGFSSSSGTAYARRSPETTTTESDAFSGNDYFQFTVTPDTGKVLNLTSLQLKQYATTTETGDDRWTGYLFVRSSALDNYGSNVDTTTSTRGSRYYDGSTLPTSTDVSLDLSDAAFQGIDETVTFRIYLYHDVTTTGAADFHRLDDVVLNGVVVPEPSALALGAFGLLGIAAYRRRRRRS